MKQSLPRGCCGSKKGFFNVGKVHLLEYLIKKYQIENIAEIGVFTGNLTSRIIKNCKGIIKKYYCVDPWKPYPEHYNREPRPEELTAEYWEKIYNRVNGLAVRNPEIQIIRASSMEAVDEVPDFSLDLVYIDAIHEYKEGLEDINAWINKVKDGGFVAGHDYMPRFKGLIRAIDQVFGDDIQVIKDSNWFVKIDADKRKKYNKGI